MLTISQVETVAFVGDGGIHCPDCAISAYGPISVGRAEQGFASDVEPLSRYGLGEFEGERQYEYAEQRVLDFIEDHPTFEGVLRHESENGYRRLEWTRAAYDLIHKLADREPGESCSDCGKELDP